MYVTNNLCRYILCSCEWSKYFATYIRQCKSSIPEVFLGKGVLKICNKFTGECPCRNAISIKLQTNFIEIALRYGYSLVSLLHIFRTPFPQNTSEGLPLSMQTIFFMVASLSLYSENCLPSFFFSVIFLACLVKCPKDPSLTLTCKSCSEQS